jgi:hypothetical protein
LEDTVELEKERVLEEGQRALQLHTEQNPEPSLEES